MKGVVDILSDQGVKMWMYDLNRAVRIRFRVKVQGFIFLRMFLVWLCLTPVKWTRQSSQTDGQ